jgi:hypothetical protein
VVRTWLRALAAALVTAAMLGAGQLGVAYGLGILRWNQTFEAGNENGWSAHLAWTAWIAALAVVGGAVAGVHSLRRHGHRDAAGAWVSLSVAALFGAAVTVPLVALPAREAQVALPLNPALQAGVIAGVGAAVGLFGALAVLCARPVAGGVLFTTVWVWLLALVSAGAQLGSASLPAGQRLGVLRLPGLGDHATQELILPVTVGMAALVALLIAGYARWLGEHPFAVAASGLAGPALLAAAYVVAGPGIAAGHNDQRQPWLAALVSVGAGLAVSVLIAAVRRRRPVDAPPASTRAADAGLPLAATAGLPLAAAGAPIGRPEAAAGAPVADLPGVRGVGDPPVEPAAPAAEEQPEEVRPEPVVPVGPITRAVPMPRRAAATAAEDDFVGWVSGLRSGGDVGPAAGDRDAPGSGGSRRRRRGRHADGEPGEPAQPVQEPDRPRLGSPYLPG